jgi:transcriptional regulator with PAS, ATPase and Fis domain
MTTVETLARITFDAIVHQSHSMHSTIELAKRAAGRDVTMLITGESGTGKELIAHAIHNASRRADEPFVPVNCAAMPDTLLESELFGHEAGAFTSAVGRRHGKFELASGGTLFLDEVGNTSPAAQAKLLRSIETQCFERVGGETTIDVDVRIIAATNIDPMAAIADGKFRMDLYYRLNEVHVHVPALRERKEDIPPLVDYFLDQFNQIYDKKIKRVSHVAMDFLLKHDWPGNVRELRSVIKSGVVLTDRDELWLDDFPFDVSLNTPDAANPDLEYLSLEAMEKRHIARVLHTTGWNKTKAAKLLKISRPRLDRKIQAYELRPS